MDATQTTPPHGLRGYILDKDGLRELGAALAVGRSKPWYRADPSPLPPYRAGVVELLPDSALRALFGEAKSYAEQMQFYAAAEQRGLGYLTQRKAGALMRTARGARAIDEHNKYLAAARNEFVLSPPQRGQVGALVLVKTSDQWSPSPGRISVFFCAHQPHPQHPRPCARCHKVLVEDEYGERYPGTKPGTDYLVHLQPGAGLQVYNRTLPSRLQHAERRLQNEWKQYDCEIECAADGRVFEGRTARPQEGPPRDSYREETDRLVLAARELLIARHYGAEELVREVVKGRQRTREESAKFPRASSEQIAQRLSWLEEAADREAALQALGGSGTPTDDALLGAIHALRVDFAVAPPGERLILVCAGNQAARSASNFFK